ncbi:lytic transglycosylase domain-containing protein [Dickeya poaceiphila]|uniref:Lytic transglycosylase domain-containing protein n=2 Tax=Dickeya poaceiphila TaxID=568768 RepID=A0A5B8IES8_9GAMM|nr:lytic transglycosylase domain-containing protein [Dickeya poaceiphila]
MKSTRDNSEQTAKFMEQQGKRASSFFGLIQKELLALVGLSLTATGVTSFVKNTTNGLMEISTQSKALRMSAQELDGWRKAAEAAGSSAEKMSGTLGGLQTNLEAMRQGKSTPMSEALAMLTASTGVTVDYNDNASQAMAKIASGLQKEKNQDRARTIAQMLGIDDATLQSIQRGEFMPNVQKYTAKSGITDQDIDTARKFNVQWTELHQNLEKTGYVIFNALSPYVQQFTNYLQELATWLSSHPQEIKSAIRSVLDTFSEIASYVHKGVEAVSGWKNAFEILIGLKVASWVLGVVGAFGSLLKLGAGAAAGSGAAAAGSGVVMAIAKRVGLLSLLAPSDTQSQTEEMSELERLKRKNWSANNPGIAYPESQSQHQLEQINDTQQQGNSAQDRQHQDEKSFWSKALDMLGKIGDAIITPAGAASMTPNIPGVTAPQASGKGKAMLDWMSGEFGQLEAKYGLPAGLLKSVATVESGGNQYAVSGAGAQGLFQLMPGTARDLGLSGNDSFDPHKSAQAAAKYLNQLLSQTGGDLNKALAAYNWGIGNVQRKGLGNAPLETQMYVPKVLAGMPTGAAATAPRYQSPITQQSAAPVYNFGQVTVTSNPTSASALSKDLQQQAGNRSRVLGFTAGN